MVGHEIWIVGPHGLDDGIDHAPHDGRLDTEDVGVAHRPAKEAAEDVTTRLVGREDAIAHQH